MLRVNAVPQDGYTGCEHTTVKLQPKLGCLIHELQLCKLQTNNIPCKLLGDSLT